MAAPARSRAAALAATLLLLGAAEAVAAGGADGSGTAELRRLVVAGEPAPAFSLPGLGGEEIPFRPGDGRASLLVFFSAFCPLCREVMPALEGIAARGGGTVRVVGVNLDGKRFTSAVRSFVRENALSFPILLDDVRDDLFIAADHYGVEKTPTAILVDGKGTVRGAWAGEEMRDLVRDFGRVAGALATGEPAGK